MPHADNAAKKHARARTAIPPQGRDRKRFEKELEERASALSKEAPALVKRKRKEISADVAQAVDGVLREVAGALGTARPRSDGDLLRLLDATERLDGIIEDHLASARKGVVREYVEAILWAVVLALVIRAFVFEAFKIPTGSMIPTLQIDDHIFVNKFIYGLRLPFTTWKILDVRPPKRGEIIVFEYPYEDDEDSAGKDLIKRVIAVPGDRVRVQDNDITINGEVVPNRTLKRSESCGESAGPRCPCEIRQECHGGIVYTTQHHAIDRALIAAHGFAIQCENVADWPPLAYDAQRFTAAAKVYLKPANKEFPDFVVPEDNVLVMGDNRDNSKDGRFFGLVPFGYVKGKAFVIWLATDFSRIGTLIHHYAEEGACPPTSPTSSDATWRGGSPRGGSSSDPKASGKR